MSPTSGAVHPTGYATPAALWAAVAGRARHIEKTRAAHGDRTVTAHKLIRQFVYARFLARVFADPDGQWMLKGATALLARLPAARHTTDIDLFRRQGSLEVAVDQIRSAARRRLEDHLTFAAEEPAFRGERDAQPGRGLATVRVTAYAGVKRVDVFTVDVVVGANCTDEPERRPPEVTLAVGGLTSPDYVLYPVVDHIADKVCATFETFDGYESSRSRDLVDLVVMARTQHVAADALYRAIESERVHRGLAPILAWRSPSSWVRPYEKAARDVADCAEHRTYRAANTLVRAFLDPVLTGRVDTGRWHPATGAWSSTAR